MFREEWLAEVVTVPHVPTLGPVHPGAATADLFDAVVHLEPGQFLPYDKDRRWSDRKDETVLPGHIEHTPDRTTIVTLSRRRGGRVTIYRFARQLPDLRAEKRTVARIACTLGAGGGRIVWFQPSPPTAGVGSSRVLLALTGQAGPTPARPILELDRCPETVRTTFGAFGQAAGEGIDRLAELWSAGGVRAPILVAIDAGKVVGAIGPMQTTTDPTGAVQLLPQYFAVLPGHRRGGFGRALWRAAQRWGHEAGAAYQLLQATPGSPADALYRSEGATTLGMVCSASI